MSRPQTHHTTIDSHDLKAVLADAGVTLDEVAPQTIEAPNGQPADDTPVDKGTPKETKPHEAKKPPEPPEEDEDGLTAEEKAELSAKMRKAVGRKHRQLKEAEEFAAAQYSERQLAERRIQELEARLGQLQPKQEPVESPRPRREDFENDSAYIDAQIEYGVQQALKQETLRQQKEAAEREQRQIEEAARGRVRAAMELVPDFQEVMEGATAEVPPMVAGYMQTSELFAELGYYLAKHPDELLSLSKLSPPQQLVKIGKIEAILKPFGSESKTASADGTKPSPHGDSSPSPHGKPPVSGNAPSQARNGAPVFTPLTMSGSAVEKAPEEMNIRETIQAFAKSKQVDFGRRKRH